MKKLIILPGRERRTNPLIWLVAIICAFLAVAVIITGVVIFAIYMIYQPKMPYLKVSYAQLLRLQYDQSGLLATQMTLSLTADNDNAKDEVSFSDLNVLLRFHQLPIANLQADPLVVPKNSSNILNYMIDSSPIPLDKGGMSEVDGSLKRDRISFGLQGQARTQWKVGSLLSIKFWTHLNCQLQFFPSNGSSILLDCSSKSQ